MSTPAVIEVDFKHGGVSDSNKPEIASRLEHQSAEMKEKRQSLTKEEVDQKLNAATQARAAVLEEKVKIAKELEGQNHKKQ